MIFLHIAKWNLKNFGYQYHLKYVCLELENHMASGHIIDNIFLLSLSFLLWVNISTRHHIIFSSAFTDLEYFFVRFRRGRTLLCLTSNKKGNKTKPHRPGSLLCLSWNLFIYSCVNNHRQNVLRACSFLDLLSNYDYDGLLYLRNTTTWPKWSLLVL